MSNLKVNGHITGGGEELEDSLTLKGIRDYVKSLKIDIENPASSTQYRYLDFIDKNDNRLGVIGAYQLANGTHGVYLQGRNEASLKVAYVKSNNTTCIHQDVDNIYTKGVNQPYLLASELKNDDHGYKKWSDGLLEVWGYDSQTALYSEVTIPFNLSFRNANYNVQLTWYYGSNKNIGNYAPYVCSRTTTTFTIGHDSGGAQQMKTFYYIRGKWK